MKSQNSIFAVTIPLSNISQTSTTITAYKVIQIHVILEKKTGYLNLLTNFQAVTSFETKEYQT